MKPTVVRSATLEFAALPGRASADPFRAVAGLDDANVSVRIVRLVHDPNRAPHVHAHSAEAGTSSPGTVHSGRTASTPHCRLATPCSFPRVPRTPRCPTREPKMLLVCFSPHPDLVMNIEELAGPLA
ncbi:MAG TPA: hypothetical protein VIM19_10410 [Actinomycetes bacterium]